MADRDPQIPVPRLSTTVLITRDDPFEVLMVKRHDKAFFASALVFPGGVVETDDYAAEWLPYLNGADGLSENERGLRIAGCRETFEETGMLLIEGGQPPAAPADGQLPKRFIDVVRETGGRLPLGQFQHFAHWITPVHAPKRFDTHFYLCRAPDDHTVVADGGETVSLEWIAPAKALALAAAGERTVVFPTRLNLQRLAESTDSVAALAAAAARPHFEILPVLVRDERGVFITIPAEAGYGITEEKRG